MPSRHPKNKTRYATLDKLATDPRILSIWDEYEDGLWPELASGYNCEGCSTIHGCHGEGKSPLQHLLSQIKYIEKGDPY